MPRRDSELLKSPGISAQTRKLHEPMWGGHSWLQPPFQAAPRATAKTDSCCKPKTCLPIHRAASKGGCSHEWLPHIGSPAHSGSSSFLDLRSSESSLDTARVSVLIAFRTKDGGENEPRESEAVPPGAARQAEAPAPPRFSVKIMKSSW